MNNLKQIEAKYKLKLFRTINLIVYILSLIGSFVISDTYSKIESATFYGVKQDTSTFITYLFGLSLVSTLSYLVINTLITVAENGKVTNHILLESKIFDDRANNTNKNKVNSPKKPSPEEDPWYYK